MKKNIVATSPVNHLSDDGQKEGFRALQKTSDNTSSVDSDAIREIGSLTSKFISTSKEALANAATEKERAKVLEDAAEELRGARKDILEVNARSHQSQRGFATLATKGMLVLAGAAAAGGLWMVKKKLER